MKLGRFPVAAIRSAPAPAIVRMPPERGESDRVPKQIRPYLAANPLSQFIDLFRDMVYGLTPGSVQAWAYITGWAVVAALAGSAVYRRNGKDLSEQL